METLRKLGTRVVVATLVLGAPLANQALRAQDKGQRSSQVTFTQTLPHLNGAKLAVDIVAVTYGPGAGSPPHGHPCPVIGYVLEGTVRMQVKGQAKALYTAGESFYEAPNGLHLISANASGTKPARFIAFFVCDHHAPLSTPVTSEPK